ncbi:MAG: GAF domain-containing protein, partial [Caenispirillum sp.]|nr:GAF domain-containing protein [Caenispirillum sp.]
MATGIDHIRELESVALGAPSHRDAAVVRSWRRCLDDYRLDPARACEAYIVPRSRLREHRERAEGLIRTARSGIETLHQQLAGLGYVLLLSDDRGVTVDFIGDPAFDGALQKAGLYLGSEWSERRAGTCAVGACLVTGEPLTIHQSDHFDVTHVPLTCSAAPIYDSLGNLAAVLDVSALRSAEAKTSQNLVLHMVSATARRIELATLMAQARGEWVIRFSRSPEFIEVDPDGAVAVDGSGCITATTHLAQRMLCEAVGQGVAGAGGGVIGRRLSDFLDVDPDDLPSLTRSR